MRHTRQDEDEEFDEDDGMGDGAGIGRGQGNRKQSEGGSVKAITKSHTPDLMETLLRQYANRSSANRRRET